MFASRYYADRYFPTTYFPDVGAEIASGAIIYGEAEWYTGHEGVYYGSEWGQLPKDFALVNNINVAVDTTISVSQLDVQKVNVVTATVAGLTITLPDLGSSEALVLVQQSYVGTPPTVIRN